MTHNPKLPTEALPGSPDKIEVLRLRASRRLPLFHPDDARLYPEEVMFETNFDDVLRRIVGVRGGLEDRW